MAGPEARATLRHLQSEGANSICADCDTKNPQWASVSHGTTQDPTQDVAAAVGTRHRTVGEGGGQAVERLVGELGRLEHGDCRRCSLVRASAAPQQQIELARVKRAAAAWCAQRGV